MKKIFTSESVTRGHPDKVCDQISDAILDEYLKLDNESRVACETCISDGLVIVFGEITSNAKVDIKQVVIDTIKSIGYDRDSFDIDNAKIIVNINEQSKDIALGLKDDNIGAGDQGMMFGYACKETDTYMPLAIDIAHKLAKRLEFVRTENIIDYLKPDGKTQVSVEYMDNRVRIHTILISTQHNKNIDMKKLKEDIIKHVIKPITNDLIDENTIILVNPTGRFEIGGPKGDSGLTGRKIIIDTYGGYARHGGGAFSGKDYTKVDRSGAYYARYVAKNIVASGLSDICEIEVSYGIGISKPISLYINTYNTSKIDELKLLEIINKEFNFEPKNIIKELNLKNIEYKPYSCYGHFGSIYAPWEKLDKVDTLKKYFNVKEQ